MNDPLAFTAAILAWKITGIDGLDDTLSFFIVIIGAGYLIVAVAAVIIEWGLEKGIGLISESIRNAGYKNMAGQRLKKWSLKSQCRKHLRAY